jgi:hypothetical protein
MTVRARSVIARIGAGIAVIALALVAVVASFRLHLETTIGRRGLADLLVAFIEAEIPGRMQIGAIESASSDRVVARDVRFATAGDQTVLELDHVVLDPALAEIFEQRTIGFESARIDGARLFMIDSSDGLLLERAFDEPDRPGQPQSPPSVFVHFDDVHFEHLDTIWRLSSAPRFRIDDVSGFMDFRTDERGDVVVRFDRLRGRAQTRGMPIDVSMGIDEAAGRIHASYARLAVFDLQVDIAGSPARVALELRDRGGDLEIHAQIDPDGPSLAWLGALGLDIGSDLAGLPGNIELVDDLGSGELTAHRGDVDDDEAKD